MIELIPAIDVIDGKCVRLSQGATIEPKGLQRESVEVAKMFEAHGIHRLHMVDLDGAASKHVVNYKVLEHWPDRLRWSLTFGGGIKAMKTLHIAFESGAQMVTLGSIAVKTGYVQPMDEVYGSERIILGADAKDGKIAVNGWLECGRLELMPFLDDYIKKGVAKVLCTDISRDGMLNGPSLELYKQIMGGSPDLHLIASGGISGMKDIEALNEAGIPAVVFGKAFYEGRITCRTWKLFLNS